MPYPLPDICPDPLAFLGACSDVRVPYEQFATPLVAALMPRPGVHFKAGPAFHDFYSRKNGTTPFISLPHEGGCLEWRNKGGDQIGIRHAYVLANYMKCHGIPSAALVMRDGKPPEWIYDGLAGMGCVDLRDRIQGLIEDTSLDWSFRHDVVAQAVVVGHYFRSFPFREVIRFASCAIHEGTIGMMRAVVGHYCGGQSLPLYFSGEIGPRRRDEIIDLFACHDVPVYLPA